MTKKTTELSGPSQRARGYQGVKNIVQGKVFQISAAIVVIGAVVTGGWLAYEKATTPRFFDPNLLVSFNYSSQLYGKRAYGEEDVSDKILFRLKNGEKIDAPILITLKHENSLRKISSILRYDIIDILLDNADKLFTKQYIKYEKNTERKFTTKDGHKAAEVTFTYLSQLGYFIKQRFLIVMRDEDTAIYLSAQTTKKDFDAINKKYFEKIFTSLAFE